MLWISRFSYSLWAYGTTSAWVTPRSWRGSGKFKLATSDWQLIEKWWIFEWHICVFESCKAREKKQLESKQMFDYNKNGFNYSDWTSIDWEDLSYCFYFQECLSLTTNVNIDPVPEALCHPLAQCCSFAFDGQAIKLPWLIWVHYFSFQSQVHFSTSNVLSTNQPIWALGRITSKHHLTYYLWIGLDCAEVEGERQTYSSFIWLVSDGTIEQRQQQGDEINCSQDCQD